jgi:hypothetical protein
MPKPYYEEGFYKVEITDQAMSVAGTGTPQFVLRFKVLARLENGEEEPVRSYERLHFRAITEKTIDYFVEDLRTLGFAGTSFRLLDPQTPGFHDFRGRIVEMYCRHGEDQNGNPREEWGVARSAGALELRLLPAAKYRELDNLFGRALKSAGGGANPKPPAAARAPEPRAPAPQPGITDDDVPF